MSKEYKINFIIFINLIFFMITLPATVLAGDGIEIDQAQPGYSHGAVWMDCRQSYTAGKNGFLARLSFLGEVRSESTFNIYKGEGLRLVS